MITTIPEIIKTLKLQQGHLTDTDFWFLDDDIYHVNRVMLIHDNILYYEADKCMSGSDGDINETDYRYALEFDPSCRNFFATSQIEAFNDFKALRKIEEEEENKRNSESEQKLRDALKVVDSILSPLSWDQRSKLAKLIDLKDSKDFGNFDYWLRYHKDMCDGDRCLSFGERELIRTIFHTRQFYFRNKDNSNIRTLVNLNNVLGVEASMSHCGKSCVCVTMSGNKEYFIYEKENSTMYKILSLLYNPED